MPLVFLERMSGMPRRYPAQVRDRAIKMVLSHLDEYDSVYQAAFAIGPKVGVKGPYADGFKPSLIKEPLKGLHKRRNKPSRKGLKSWNARSVILKRPTKS